MQIFYDFFHWSFLVVMIVIIIANGTANNTPINHKIDAQSNADRRISNGLTQSDLFIVRGTSI